MGFSFLVRHRKNKSFLRNLSIGCIISVKNRTESNFIVYKTPLLLCGPTLPGGPTNDVVFSALINLAFLEYYTNYTVCSHLNGFFHWSWNIGYLTTLPNSYTVPCFCLTAEARSHGVTLRGMSRYYFCFHLSREKIQLDIVSVDFMCLVSGRWNSTNSLIHCEFSYCFCCCYLKPWMDTVFYQMRSLGNYDKDYVIFFPHYSSEMMNYAHWFQMLSPFYVSRIKPI